MQIKPLKAVEQQPVEMTGASGAAMRMLIGPDQGAHVFHMRQFEVAPQGHTPWHQHDYEHEIYVLNGQGVAVAEDGEHPLHAGDVIWVKPNEMHQFRNVGSVPFEFICLIPAPENCTKA
jgi:quercetin dioxygenase-like cupin family protein